jgi:hypothetical protein
MIAQTEFVTKAFDRVYDDFRKATEATLQIQQDLFRHWVTFWPNFPKNQPNWVGQFQQFQKNWTQANAEMMHKYLEAWDKQYKAGVESLEGALRLAEAKDPGELRQQILGLWHKTFDCLKDLAQGQVQNFQTTVEKWMEMVKKGNG